MSFSIMFVFVWQSVTTASLQGLTNDFKDALDKLDQENLLQLARQDVSGWL